ncbi:MAG: hypothetical protein ACR2KL_03010 [Nocardioidaceae bacterium]
MAPRPRRPRWISGLIDECLPKVEEWVEHSNGKIRADRAHEKLVGLGYAGPERTTRRAVAIVKKDFPRLPDHRRQHQTRQALAGHVVTPLSGPR